MTQVAGSSLTDLYGIYKEYYANQQVRNALERKHTLYAMLEKDTEFAGEYYVQPIQWGTTTSSADFEVAQTYGQSPDLVGKFMVPIQTGYALATIQNAAREAARNNVGAFKDALKLRIDGAMDAQLRNDAWQIYRAGTGTIGVIKTVNTGTGVITLTNPTDALAFQANQPLGASTLDGGGTVKTPGFVLASDVSTGTIVMSATRGGAGGTPGGTAWAIGDSLYTRGNANAAIAGLGVWLPYTSTNRAVAGTPKIVFGVDCSQDPTHIQGTYLNCSSIDVESGLIELLSQVRMLGGRPEYVFVNNTSYRALSKALQARSQYTKTSFTNDAGITFQGIEVDGAIVLEDSDCPPKLAFALQMDCFKLVSYGTSPKILLYEDGVSAFRTAGKDSLESRVGGYRNFVMTGPGNYSGVASLSQ